MAPDIDTYVRRARIRQDGDLFRVEINGADICVSGKDVRTCPRGELFDIGYSTVGYRFKKDGSCLTGSETLTFERCSSSRNDQEFIIDDASLRYCLENVLKSTPANLAEVRLKERVLKAASRNKALAARIRKKPNFEQMMKKLKASKKTEKTLRKLWGYGWGSGKGWGIPRVNFC